MGVCSGLARFFLFLFNFFFWLSGAALIGVGIWFLVDDDIAKKMEVIQTADTAKDFKYAAYIFIAFGAFVFLVGFAGCCGAVRKSRCLLGVYIALMVVVMAGEIAAAVLAVIYKGEIEDSVKTGVKEKIQKVYGVKLADGKESQFTQEMDDIQEDMQCCGFNGLTDYKDSVYEKQFNATVYPGYYLPQSCCVEVDNVYVDEEKCRTGVQDYFKNSCEKSLLEWFDDKMVILIAVGFGIAALEIFGFIAAICLCREAGREGKYS